MKGINLKKIGAIVAGATILASSVAFAGLMFENTELVDANGQPVAKVVLGSGAAASDGAVAGAIAAKLASAAYAKRTLTAAVAADATCSTGATGGTGTCAVSGEKVTLEVTVPGTTAAGVHDFSTLIGDYVDRTLQNRINNITTDDLYSLTNSETDVDANPFSNGNNSNIGLGATALYKIDSTKFSPFAAKTIVDGQSGMTYTETQNIWVEGTTQYSSADKAIEFSPSLIIYQVKFDDPKRVGIVKCTSESTTIPKYWGWCTNADADYTGKHRVKISFLGSDWIITDIIPTDTPIVNADMVAAGGALNLAKESVYGIINIGDSMTSSDGQLKVRLDDISTPTGQFNVHPAIVSFLDANGNVLSQDQINAGSTVKKTVGGKTYKVRVYQTAPGYTFGAKWAEMALLEQELELKDNQKVDSGKNIDWTVRLFWKNRDGAIATTANQYLDDADALRSILVYKSSFGSALLTGDAINIVEVPVAYKLSYKGVDLASTEYDTLKYATGGSITLTLDDATTFSLASNQYIKISSNVDDAFQASGTALQGTTGTVNTKGKEIYYVRGHTNSTLNGSIVMLKSGSSNYVVLNSSTVGNSGNPDIQYKTAGSSGTVTDGGLIRIVNRCINSTLAGNNNTIGGMACGNFTAATPVIELIENIGTAYIGSTKDDHAVGVSEVYYGSGGFVSSKAGSTATDKVVFMPLTQVVGTASEPYILAANKIDLSALGYSSPSGVVGAEYTKGEFISPRGTKFDSMSSSAVTFKVATRLGKAAYQFATSEAAAVGAETTTLTLAEGESGTVSTVTIKAKSIDQTIGACTATGGAATCTVPKDQISAVIMPNNAASVDAVVPFAINPKMVVLDRDAAATTTGVLITVGGDRVNTVTADAMAGAGIDFTATPVVVKQVGNKIIVAGLTAEDTITAGDQFLAKVRVV